MTIRESWEETERLINKTKNRQNSKTKKNTKPVVPVTIEAKADTETKIATKTCYKVLKYLPEFNMKKHKNHLSSDWILNESDYSAGTTPVELGCFDTYEEAKALFESEKPNCDCDVIFSRGILTYSTNVLEIEVDKIEIDEDGFEDIVDCDFLDYYTVPYEPKQDEDDDEEEDE